MLRKNEGGREWEVMYRYFPMIRVETLAVSLVGKYYRRQSHCGQPPTTAGKIIPLPSTSRDPGSPYYLKQNSTITTYSDYKLTKIQEKLNNN